MEKADEFAKKVWTAMCDLYRTHAVSQLCVHLQNSYGVDVPLLLMLFYADQWGMGSAIDAFLTDAASWREDVIKPLRTIRQAMKGSFTELDEVQLREAVKALELQAEHIHVSRLVRSFLLHANATDANQMSDTYLERCGVPEEEREAALTVFQAAVNSSNVQDHNERESCDE